MPMGPYVVVESGLVWLALASARHDPVVVLARIDGWQLAC